MADVAAIVVAHSTVEVVAKEIVVVAVAAALVEPDVEVVCELGEVQQ